MRAFTDLRAALEAGCSEGYPVAHRGFDIDVVDASGRRGLGRHLLLGIRAQDVDRDGWPDDRGTRSVLADGPCAPSCHSSSVWLSDEAGPTGGRGRFVPLFGPFVYDRGVEAAKLSIDCWLEVNPDRVRPTPFRMAYDLAEAFAFSAPARRPDSGHAPAGSRSFFRAGGTR